MKIVVSNAKPGETSISRLIEPKPLQGVTSNNGGDYIVKVDILTLINLPENINLR